MVWHMVSRFGCLKESKASETFSVCAFFCCCSSLTEMLEEDINVRNSFFVVCCQ